MVPIDFLSISVLLLVAWRGYRKGILAGLGNLLGLMVGVRVGLYLGDEVKRWFISYPGFPFVQFLPLFCIFLASIMLMRLAVFLTQAMIDDKSLGTLGSVLGACADLVAYGTLMGIGLWMIRDVVKPGGKFMTVALYQVGEWSLAWIRNF